MINKFTNVTHKYGHFVVQMYLGHSPDEFRKEIEVRIMNRRISKLDKEFKIIFTIYAVVGMLGYIGMAISFWRASYGSANSNLISLSIMSMIFLFAYITMVDLGVNRKLSKIDEQLKNE